MDEYSQNWFLSKCSFILFLRLILLIIRIKYSVAFMCNINPFFKRWLLRTKPNPYRSHAEARCSPLVHLLSEISWFSFLPLTFKSSFSRGWVRLLLSEPQLWTWAHHISDFCASLHIELSVRLGVWTSLNLRFLLSVITRTCTDLIIWNV